MVHPGSSRFALVVVAVLSCGTLSACNEFVLANVALVGAGVVAAIVVSGRDRPKECGGGKVAVDASACTNLREVRE